MSESKEIELLKAYTDKMENKDFVAALKIAEDGFERGYISKTKVLMLMAKTCDLYQRKTDNDFNNKSEIRSLIAEVLAYIKVAENEFLTAVGWWMFHSLEIIEASEGREINKHLTNEEQFYIVLEINASLFEENTKGMFYTVHGRAIEKYKYILLPSEYSANKNIIN